MSKQDTKDCVVVLVTNGRGGVCFGKRKDNGKYTLVAGHIEEGEAPEEAAKRETKEETGLDASFLVHIREEERDGSKIYFYATQCKGTPTAENDPDKECSWVRWVDVSKGIPKNVYEKLAGPTGDDNLVRQIYQMKKSEFDYLEAGFLNLSKAETEVSTLLAHPNPKERQLALKLKSVTPEDLAVAILDPSEDVFRAAFNHPDSSHALDVLSCSTKDASGAPIFGRHDLLLGDPRKTDGHIKNMASAVRRDSTIPVQEQAQRLRILAQHGYSDFVKHENVWAHHLLYAGSHQGTAPTRHENEEPLEHLKPLKAQFEGANSKALEPHNAGIQDVGQVSPKAVYHVGEHKLMVKPYQEEEYPLSGWSEGASQQLYHSAGLGHLHQQSFVSNHGSGKYSIPVTVIKLDTEAIPAHKAPLQEARSNNPALDDEARKVAVMDFLTGNQDRHLGNLMVQRNGHLLAIDHASAFRNGGSLDKNIQKLSTVAGTDNSKYHKLLKEWWPRVAPDVKAAFNKRIDNILHPQHRRNVEDGFNSRFDWLNRKAQEEAPNLSDYNYQPLEKKEPEATNNGMDLQGMHEALMSKHPASMNADVENYNMHVAKAKPEPVHNSSKFAGAEEKSLYQHGDKKYLVKPTMSNAGWKPNHLAGWGEMTNQAMYHAGGIGHLHQKVHATNTNGVNTIAIHIQPGMRELAEVTDPQERQKIAQHPDIRKIAFMDFLTNNTDRHNSNLMVDKEGNPLAIDHSFAFQGDNQGGWPESQSDEWLEAGDGLGLGDMKPDAATWDWWNKNRGNIVNKYNEHLSLIPDRKVRQRMKDNFDYRLGAIDEGKTPLGQPFGKTEELLKSLEGVDFLHQQHNNPNVVKKPDMSGVHDKLKMATPEAIKPHRQRFELGLNQHNIPVKPIFSKGLSKPDNPSSWAVGTEPKSIYQHGEHKFLVKPVSDSQSALSGWNEMTSQAMYHAGGIGHLHQKVHATSLPGHENAHGIVVHMEPDARQLSEAQQDEDPRVKSMIDSPEHRKSLQKMGIMDWLTSNSDRHTGNIMVKPDGSPIAIDHGRAFDNDRAVALGTEAGNAPEFTVAFNNKIQADPNKQKELLNHFNGFSGNYNSQQPHYSDASHFGGVPESDTWDWWDQNKDKMRDAFKKHVNMLPDENVRNRMQQSFDVRFNHINDLRNRHLESENTPAVVDVHERTAPDRTLKDKNRVDKVA